MHHSILRKIQSRAGFGKLPGAFVYDMDGVNSQINIATHSWIHIEVGNTMLAKMASQQTPIYGCPLHYSAPLESVKQIEIVRGVQLHLQYQAQFGGASIMWPKQADTTKTIGGEAKSLLQAAFGLMVVTFQLVEKLVSGNTIAITKEG